MIDHCMPIILGASLIILFLVGVIIYFLAKWEPKRAAKPVSSAKKPAKKN